MTDERDKELVPDADAAPEINSLEDAFAAIEARDAAAAKGDESGPAGADAGADSDKGGVDGAGTPGTPGSAPGDTPGSDDSALVPDNAGGDADGDGLLGDQGDGEPPVSVTEAVAAITEEVEQRTLTEVRDLFLNHADEAGNKLIRQTNGQLGATINDPDIYRVGENGAGVFYNPDTGKPFTGDNPREQAKQWCAGYNEDLRTEFNQRAEAYQLELMKEQEPVIALLKFDAKFDALDPVRQRMFEALIEDYEIKDKTTGDVIGYSVDLDKALAQVNRQVSSIQATTEKPAATGPSVDMPNSGASPDNKDAPKSLEEALSRAQDALLAEGSKKK